jgi:hypothetical protein
MEDQMRASIVQRIIGSIPLAMIAACVALGAPAAARANVITDWDEIAITLLKPLPNYPAERIMGMIHCAMFDAVNSIERRYRPYLVQPAAEPATSKEAAAAAAASAVLAAVDENTATQAKAELAKYLASIPPSAAKSEGVRLGEAVAAKVLEARANDGSDAPDDYRPRTTPGVYVATPILAASTWSRVKPFALTKSNQFRPEPPVPLESKEWARDFNEIKEYGRKSSNKRTAEQTEAARFWLMTGPGAYHPFVRQLVLTKQMNVLDSARFMTLVAIGLNDAYIAVFDAKYHYNFWRPITAIRNGDNDNNPATDREATWQPIDNTPMHPEYPCAHCIVSGTVAGVVKAALGTEEIPETALGSTTAPGVTHRWTNMVTFSDEVANARIWAGFHYRFSTRVGTQMGRVIGDYVVKNAMQSAQTSSR